MEELIVKTSIDVAAPPEAVWRVLTEPALTKKYMFGCEAVTDWRPGSSLEWVITADGKRVTPVKGKIVECARGERLVYTVFGNGMGLADEPRNYLTVSCTLTKQGSGTRLDVTQGDFAAADNGRARYEETAAGWPQVLAQVKALAESLP
jgi:uncharacterized protein YndB with AHSA1/START domain